jgi:hypothetical protein
MTYSNQPAQNRPTSPALAPDPTDIFDRDHPEHESGQGALDAPKTRVPRQPDRIPACDSPGHNTSRTLNSDPCHLERDRTAGGVLSTETPPQHAMDQEDPAEEGPDEVVAPNQLGHHEADEDPLL